MLAVRRADVRALNAATRARLLTAGRLGPDRLLIELGERGSREFRVGDQVVVTGNDYSRGLVNGLRGQITALDRDRAGLDLQLTDGRPLHVPAESLLAGRLEHGYALTVHRAQGITVDVALLFASQAVTRESGYVAMSRGRDRNELYTTWDAMSSDQHDQTDTDIRTIDPVRTAERGELTDAALVSRLETRRAQRLASSQLQDRARQAAERHRAAMNQIRRTQGRGR
jgi:ATP-dependent exoDNAse (exonuclease V) alpha subunit